MILLDITLPLFGGKGLCSVPCADFHIAALTHFSHDQSWVEHGESETSHKSCVQAQHQEDGLLGLSVTERASAL